MRVNFIGLVFLSMIDLDQSWLESLYRKFELVSVEEADVINNLEASVTVTTMWLRASFYVLVTAIPLLNSFRDYAGYMLLMTTGKDT